VAPEPEIEARSGGWYIGISLWRLRAMKARQFDAAFDAGQDVSNAVDWSRAQRANLDMRRVSVDLPAWMVEALDREAREQGVTQEDLIRLWIRERLG